MWKVTVVENNSNEVLEIREYEDHPDPEELGESLDDLWSDKSITVTVEEVEE